MIFLLAMREWPDAIDISALFLFFGIVSGCMFLGYLMMVMDFRAYLRALRGVLVRVAYHFPEIPSWARYETPGCLLALGLRLPCTEQQVKEAYRRLAEQLHPDRGGDRHKFLRLQRQFESSIEFLKAHEPEFRSDPAAS